MSLLQTVSIFWSEHFYTFLNVGFVACNIIESYIFPFLIIKCTVILTKCGGFVSLMKIYMNEISGVNEIQQITRFKYTLLLIMRDKRKGYGQPYGKLESHMSLVTEMRKEDKYTQLSYCGQECTKIPPALGKLYGDKVHYLDLSYNVLETLKGLEQFTRVEELILDNNKLGDNVAFPLLPRLKTLSINNNQITDLEGLLTKIQESFPYLSYLSVMSNKACPDQLTGGDDDDSDYQRYRYYVIHKLRCLRFLDSRRVSARERNEALLRGQFMRVRRPSLPERLGRPPPPAPAPESASAARALPLDLAALGKHRGAYGKCQYKYTGKHSEGNRFIVNSDL